MAADSGRYDAQHIPRAGCTKKGGATLPRRVKGGKTGVRQQGGRYISTHVYLPDNLIADVKAAAKRAHCTMSYYVQSLLATHPELHCHDPFKDASP